MADVKATPSGQTDLHARPCAFACASERQYAAPSSRPVASTFYANTKTNSNVSCCRLASLSEDLNCSQLCIIDVRSHQLGGTVSQYLVRLRKQSRQNPDASRHALRQGHADLQDDVSVGHQ
jgi:hypothetical protein